MVIYQLFWPLKSLPFPLIYHVIFGFWERLIIFFLSFFLSFTCLALQKPSLPLIFFLHFLSLFFSVSPAFSSSSLIVHHQLLLPPQAACFLLLTSSPSVPHSSSKTGAAGAIDRSSWTRRSFDFPVTSGGADY